MFIGAYYYSWYKADWLKKTVRKKDLPLLGEYNNKTDLETVIKQMLLMKKYGIDFISVSFGYNDNIEHIFHAAETIDIKVTCHYESLSRASDKKNGVIKFQDLDKIISDLKRIKKYVKSPSWLRINNKPVLMLYVTRCYEEKRNEMFKEIRKVFDNKIYLVGDELFWNVLQDPSRIQDFDAVTSYNFYKNEFKGNNKQEKAMKFLTACKGMMKRHAEICKAYNKVYWPVAMPGYNDTGVRPDAKHQPISRLDGNFFKLSLQDAIEISNRFCPQTVMLTSWNEWYEDTQIEPAKSYKNKYLEMVKEFKK